MNILVRNIRWETDGHKISKGKLTEGNTLPETVLILGFPDNEIEDVISDLLSDTFGWLHNGFVYEDTKNMSWSVLTYGVDAIVPMPC